MIIGMSLTKKPAGTEVEKYNRHEMEGDNSSIPAEKTASCAGLQRWLVD
jgi:hypothetical protein